MMFYLTINLFIFHIKCQCDADYVDRTGQHLKAWINQHRPANICKGNFGNSHRYVSTTINLPVLYPRPVLSAEDGSLRTSFVLESIYIKSCQISLCNQKEWFLAFNCDIFIIYHLVFGVYFSHRAR